MAEIVRDPNITLKLTIREAGFVKQLLGRVHSAAWYDDEAQAVYDELRWELDDVLAADYPELSTTTAISHALAEADEENAECR